MVCRAVRPAVTSNLGQSPHFVAHTARAHDDVDPQQLAVMGDQLRGRGSSGSREPPSPPHACPAGLLDYRPLLLDQPGGLVVLALQAGLLDVLEVLVLADELVSLDRPGDDPNQVARGGGMDADITVGADLVAQGGHLLLALLAQYDHRLVGPAGAIAFDEVQGVQLVRLVADQHGVEDFVVEPGHPVGAAHDLFQDDLRGAVAGQGLGQPPARPLPRGDVEGLDPRRQPCQAGAGGTAGQVFSVSVASI